MPGILETYRNKTLGEIFSDNSWVSIYDDSLDWLELPPEHFLKYAENRPRYPFDGVPDDPAIYRNNPTFMILQAHRVWLTLQKIDKYFTADPSALLVDLGAYPFTLDLAVRNFLHRDCRILSTINQRKMPEWEEALRENAIETAFVNLDPLVLPTTPIEGMTDHVPLPDNSVDFVLFSHVVEHLYQPLSILQESARILKKGGHLLISTDNAFLLGGFLNYLTDGPYLHEPIENTAAMVFTEWRGHVRFYTEGDLRTMLEKAGLSVVESSLYEVSYNSVLESYFVDPFVKMPKWRADLLRTNPVLRNEIMLVAQK